MCDEAKRHKAAEMGAWGAAGGNPNDYPNEMPPGDSDRRNWKSTREQPLNQHPWRYQELSDAMVHLRQSLRTILHRHGIPSNPAWADQEIINGVADKLGEYARRLEAAEATNYRLALERNALKNRLSDQPSETKPDNRYKFRKFNLSFRPEVRDDCGGPIPAEAEPGEMTDRQAIAALREEHLAFRERIVKEMEETRHSVASLPHVQRLEAAIADHAGLLKELRKDLELRDLRVACIADDEEKHAQALGKMISDVNEKLGSLCMQVDGLTGLVDGTPKMVNVRGLEEIRRIATRNECDIHGLKSWQTKVAKFLNDQQESIEKLEGETDQHRARLASFDELCVDLTSLADRVAKIEGQIVWPHY